MSDPVTRRAFLKASAGLTAGTGVVLGTPPFGTVSGAPCEASQPGSAGTTAAGKKVRFSGMVTLGDWAVFHGVWGEPGVYYILKHMKDAGFSRVYWRTTDGCGQANYPSRVTNAAQQFVRDEKLFPEQVYIREFLDQARPAKDRWLQGSVDFSRFDSVKTARDWARRLGLEFYAWHEHAEDHGGVGQPSRMMLEHPEWLTRNRDGKASHCRFSWASKPALDHRLALVREVLSYEPDGLFFDFVKSMEGSPGKGCTPHWDEKGVWYCTYDRPAIEAFKKKTGRDPLQIPNDDEEWVLFRAAYMTGFMRSVREMQKKEFPKVKLGVFGCPSGRACLRVTDKVEPAADPLRAYLEDHETWTREGLIDEFVNAYTDGSVFRDPAKLRSMIQDSRSRIHTPVPYQGTQMEVYGIRDEGTLLQAVETIAAAGCKEVVFFETTPLQANRTWEAAAKAIRQFSG
jgi:hypothetical protein